MVAWTRSHHVREGALLLGLAPLLIFGSRVAQQRQVPPRVPLDAGAYVLLAVVVVTVAGRTRWPRTVFTSTVLAVGVYLALGYPYGPIFVAASVSAFAPAGVVSASAGAGAIGLAVVVWVAAETPQVAATGEWGSLLPLSLGSAAWLVFPIWLATIRLRAADARAADEDRRLRELGELRLELAREVHDVVAHNLTVIGVQAGAALRVFDRDPDTARAALGTIARTNRQALAELRGTVDLVRGPGPGGASGRPESPAADLAGIDALIASARSTGATVSSSATGTPGHTAPQVERAAHRIVQEALTNALRHAPGATIDVLVDHGSALLRVEVGDDGPGVGDRAEGRGIRGMRERADAAGGAVSVTVNASGGTTVRATFPAVGSP